MLNFRHTLAAMGLLAYGTLPALCAPLPADAINRISTLLLESVTALIVQGDPGKNAQRAMTFCRDAEKIAKRIGTAP
jgi:hypothetical protein